MTKLTTLGKVYEQVQEMSKGCSDKMVNVKDISFDNLEVVNIDGAYFPLRSSAQQNICNRLQIPSQYLRRCNSDVQRYNLNHWIKKERNEELFIRFDRQEIRAIFTPRYTPMDNLEVLDRIMQSGFSMDTPAQVSVDAGLMLINIPDGDRMFSVNGEKHMPGLSVANSEVGLSSLSISSFVLRLVCTNGLISKTAVSGSYRHISTRILEEFPKVLANAGSELDIQKRQLKISLESKVENPAATIESFNRQFGLNDDERKAVKWGTEIEYGETMFAIVNCYTKASQHEGLPSESSYKLQRVGGMILSMVK